VYIPTQSVDWVSNSNGTSYLRPTSPRMASDGILSACPPPSASDTSTFYARRWLRRAVLTMFARHWGVVIESDDDKVDYGPATDVLGKCPDFHAVSCVTAHSLAFGLVIRFGSHPHSLCLALPLSPLPPSILTCLLLLLPVNTHSFQDLPPFWSPHFPPWVWLCYKKL